MKKFFIAALAVCATLAASAADVKESVKDLEKSFKGTDNMTVFKQHVDENQAVFADPELSKIFEIYLVPGNIAWKLYDNMYMQQTLGQQVNPQEMAAALLNGYDFYTKALEAGPYTDAKGKEKKPDTKKLVNTLAGHYNDLSMVGQLLWDARDFNGAYEMWSNYVDVMQNPTYREALKGAAPADSTIAYGNYLKALAAWQADKLPEALAAFQAAIDGGYENENVYDYALQCANQAQDNEKMFYYAQAGLNKYGTSNTNFLLLTLNGYIDQKKFTEARQLLDEAIAKNPNDPVYYFSMGILEENLGNIEPAIAAMKKAVEIKPDYAVGYYNLGRLIYEKSEKIDSEAVNMPAAEYNTYKENTLAPLLKESAAAFEKAYELDPENQANSIQFLKRIYYVLEDEANLKRVENLF